MEQSLLIEGHGLKPLLDYLEKVQDTELDENSKSDFEFKGRFDTELNKRLDASLLAIFLSGLGPTLIKLIVDYFKDRHSNDITIKTKKPDGTEMTFTLKNRSEQEIKDWLRAQGFAQEA